MLVSVATIVVTAVVFSAILTLAVAPPELEVIIGLVVSTTKALEPAILLEPVGTVVLVIGLPALSATVPITKLLTVKSLLVSPAPTV